MILTFLIIEAIILLGLIFSVEYENDGLSAALTIIAVTTAFIIFWTNPFVLLAENIGLVLYGIAAWFVIGGLWAIFKWWTWLGREEVQEEIKSAVSSWRKYREKCRENTDEEINDEDFFNDVEGRKFRAAHNKSRIFRWILYWPASLIWSLLYRAVRRIVIWVYNRILRILDSISKAQINRAIKSKV